MAELAAQSGTYEALLRSVTDAPEWLQTQIANSLAQLEHVRDPNEIAANVNGVMAAQIHLNQQSVNNEASLIQGGYDPTVATAVSASVGIGADAQAVEQASADFAREVARAIMNGQTLNEVRTADPNLSLAAQQAIYEQVAQQQGTTAAEIEAKAAAAKAADMQAVQGVVFGAAAAATATEPTFGNLMWGEKPKTVELSLSDKEANPLAAALAGTEIAQKFAAALNNMEPSEQQGNAGQPIERDAVRSR